MIRVIHVVISLDPGGLERLVLDMTNARNRRDSGSAMICCLDDLGGLAQQVDGAAVSCLDADRSRFPWDRAAVRRLREMMDDRGQREESREQRAESIAENLKDKPESGAPPHAPCSMPHAVILHAHNTAAWQYAVLAARGTGAKVVATHHGSNLYTRGIINNLRNRWLSKHTDAVAAVSDSVRKELQSTWGFGGTEIQVIPNGVTIEVDHRHETIDHRQNAQIPKHPSTQMPKCPNTRISNQQPTIYPPDCEAVGRTSNPITEQLRTEFGVSPDAFVVGSVGRFSSEKNYPLLIEAFSVLHKRRPDAKLLLVGDGPERRSLEQSAKSMGVEDCVIFTGFRDDARELLQTMDVFCLSSDSEGLSLALLEAGICGKAVVVTNAGGNAEVVRDGVDGFVVPPRSVTALANALEKLGMDLKLRGEMGQALRTRVLEQYSFSRMMSEYEKLYDIVSR